jgi:hypothetical protein
MLGMILVDNQGYCEFIVLHNLCTILLGTLALLFVDGFKPAPAG